MSESECIFCKIIKGQIPARTIYESQNVIAFLDIAPATAGHTVIVPKVHFYNLIDMPENIMGSFLLDVKKIGKLIMDKLKVEGFNLIQNNFEIAGQVVPHAHFHIIPRYKNDSIKNFKKDPKEATPEKLDEIFNLFK